MVACVVTAVLLCWRGITSAIAFAFSDEFSGNKAIFWSAFDQQPLLNFGGALWRCDRY